MAKKMSGQIFISYRRDDSSAWAGRLSDHLSSHFPSNQIFMDVDTIEPGIDFVEAIKESVGSCDVLIAVIGTHWLTSSNRAGIRRLEIPEDSVRVEIATALKRGIRVIPVLVEGATMPDAGDLPDDLKALVHRNAIQLSHDRFRTDSERLESTLKGVLEKAAAERREREEKERLEHEPQAQLPSSAASVAPFAKPEADKPSAEIRKVVYPLPPKSVEPEREKSLPPSSGGTGGKSPSNQVIVILAIAAVLVVGGLIYLAIRASQSPPPQPAPIAAATPSPPVIATPTVEKAALEQFYFDYQGEPQPGRRIWKEVQPGLWVENYESGEQSSFKVNQNETIDDAPGIIATKISGNEKLTMVQNGTMQVFIPLKNSPSKWMRFRHFVNGSWEQWQNLAQITYN